MTVYGLERMRFRSCHGPECEPLAGEFHRRKFRRVRSRERRICSECGWAIPENITHLVTDDSVYRLHLGCGDDA